MAGQKSGYYRLHELAPRGQETRRRNSRILGLSLSPSYVHGCLIGKGIRPVKKKDNFWALLYPPAANKVKSHHILLMGASINDARENWIFFPPPPERRRHWWNPLYGFRICRDSLKRLVRCCDNFLPCSCLTTLPGIAWPCLGHARDPWSCLAKHTRLLIYSHILSNFESIRNPLYIFIAHFLLWFFIGLYLIGTSTPSGPSVFDNFRLPLLSPHVLMGLVKHHVHNDTEGFKIAWQR